jgi:hypothetical protein
MIITREEKESLVLDLYNQRTPIRVIAKEAGMSFRDIRRIIDKKEKEKEAKQGQAQQIFASTQAYKLFSEGKSPVQVAIALNIREPEVVKFYAEYWNQVQHHSLGRIYEEIKDGIGHFVRLYRLAKVARIGVKLLIYSKLPVLSLGFEASASIACSIRGSNCSNMSLEFPDSRPLHLLRLRRCELKSIFNNSI